VKILRISFLPAISCAYAPDYIQTFISFTVGDIPNGYTSDVVLNQQARVARVVWRIAYRAAQLLEAHGGYGTQELMADPVTGPWRVAL
jgi:hypothetical protein